MKQEREIKNIFALLFMKGRAIVIGMIVGAILLGGYQGVTQILAHNDPSNAPSAVEERYNAEMANYNSQVANYVKQIQWKEEMVQNEEEKLNNSIYFSLDPDSFYNTHVYLAINLPKEEMDETENGAATPAEYKVTRIQNLYNYIWASLNLGEVAALEDYHASNETLREMVAAWGTDGGLITINSYGSSEEEAKALAGVACQLLMSQQDEIRQIAYDHELTIMSEITVQKDGQEMLTARAAKVQNIMNYKGDIAKLKKDKGTVAVPEKGKIYTKKTIAIDTLVSVAMGAGVGMVLVVLVILIGCVLNTQVIAASEVEAYTSLKLLGVVSGKKKGFGIKVGTQIAEGKQWDDAEKAVAYTARMIELYANGNSVLLTSTCGIKEDEIVQKMVDLLKAKKINVTVAQNAFVDAEAIDCIANGASVFLLERPTVSKLELIRSYVEKMKNVSADVEGFILIHQ